LAKQFQGQALIHNRQNDLDEHLLTPCKCKCDLCDLYAQRNENIRIFNVYARVFAN